MRGKTCDGDAAMHGYHTRVRGGKCGVRSAECGVRSAEFGMRSCRRYFTPHSTLCIPHFSGVVHRRRDARLPRAVGAAVEGVVRLDAVPYDLAITMRAGRR